MKQRSYDFDESIEAIKAIDDAGDISHRDALLVLTDKEFKSLYYGFGSTARFMNEFNKTLKAAAVERRNDYGKMVRYAKKRFNEVDIQILELLHGDNEHIYHKVGIFNHLREEDNCWDVSNYPRITNSSVLNSSEKHRQMVKSLKLMKRRGLIEVVMGWSEDEGTPGGSGYTEMHHKSDVIEQVIYNYRVETQELPL